MLQVKDVRKKYVTGDFEQIALNGVSLNLRDNEFVAILGPSGSGKTTLLNIIGGLDRYDSGDLVINGVSTKKYKDRDWDSYRNHTVGFVFQSYNLIPHQTVLANVELALTIGGISSAKRKEMALDALEQVGLREQAHKRPNQMSGGQMQRVAIARALVNNPKILLADEPTGALDTKTSVQVMELLKEVAKDRLVVMVTHNPELAEEYANRIVRVKDGSIVDDTNPLLLEEDTPAVHKNLGKASMSLLTSFGLSLNNLMTKKGRTFLTAFAGSIGIIGIALILSLSTGFQNYIDQIQEETMTSYPLTIYEESSDVISAMLTLHTEAEKEAEEGTLVEQKYIATMMGAMVKNDLGYFKDYLENHEEEYMDNISMIKYSYSVSPLIYTIDVADNLAQINPSTSMSGMSSYSILSSYSSFGSTFSEITDLEKMKSSYTLVAGEWPDAYNEMIAVVSDPNQISDLLLYSLGFRNTKELKSLLTAVMSGETVETDSDTIVITYQDLMNLELKLINPTDRYRYNEQYGTYEDMSDDDTYMRELYQNGENLRIVGIVCAEDSSSSSSSGIMYLPELTYHVINLAEQSELVQKQLADKDVDVFSGKRFDEEDNSTGLDFGDMISMDSDSLSDAFQMNMDMSSLSGLSGLSSLGSLGSSSSGLGGLGGLGSSGTSTSLEDLGLDEETMRTIVKTMLVSMVTDLADVPETMTNDVKAIVAVDQTVALTVIESIPTYSGLVVALPAESEKSEKPDTAETETIETTRGTTKTTTNVSANGTTNASANSTTNASANGTTNASANGTTNASVKGTGNDTAIEHEGANTEILAAVSHPFGLSWVYSEQKEQPAASAVDSSSVQSGTDGGSSQSGNGGSGSAGSQSGGSSSAGNESGGSGSAGSQVGGSETGGSGSAGSQVGESETGGSETGAGSSTGNETGSVENDGSQTESGENGETETDGDETSGSETGGSETGAGSSAGNETGSTENDGDQTSGSDSTTYINYVRVDDPDAQKAFKEEAMKTVASVMRQQEYTDADPENVEAVVSQAIDNYFEAMAQSSKVQEKDGMKLIAVSDLPDPTTSINRAIVENSMPIFQEAFESAKQTVTETVVTEVTKASTTVMTTAITNITQNLGSSLSSSLMSSLSALSSLSGLANMFSGDFLTIDEEKFAEAFQFDMDEDELKRLMESMMTGDTASYNNNLLGLGYQDLNKPTSISFYFKDFESKGNFTDWLENYNDIMEEDKQLTYSDLTGLLMGSVETIINSVTYVLIAFVSISLIVSSIMIGIITYISVLERTKEIGILRAIGASKRNISSIFNAETFIIGFLSGLIGVFITWLLNFPINMVIHNVTNNPDITAVLGIRPAIILVIISTLLTMIGGLIPSGSASRKDPVIALRSE